MQSIIRRSLSPARNHRLTLINTDGAQIKISVCIRVYLRQKHCIRFKTAARGFAFKLVYQKNGAMQLWLNKNRLTASGTLKSTVVRIWYRTPFGRPHKVYFVSLTCLPSVFVQFICNVRHSCHIQSISMRSLPFVWQNSRKPQMDTDER